MEHKRLRHTGEEVKAKKATSSGVRVRSRDTCAREKRLSAQSDHKVKGGSRRCGVVERHRPFFLRYGGVGRHRRTVSHRASPPFPSFTEQTWGTTQTARRSIPFSHTKPEKHEDSFNTFQLIPQRDQLKSFRFFKKHKGRQSIKCSAVGQKLVVF